MSTTKARINRIAYIGWRGIYGCEVLELDDGPLTGLVGPAGAGKTTLAMCLDYALLPDRKALNIQPISDVQDSQQAGVDSLSGRISKKYGYAYVAIDVTTRHDSRLIAGIFVEPVDGRAEFTRWLIRNAPEDMPLHDILSVKDGDNEYHPDFPELKRYIASKGMDVITCRSVGEYGEALYDAGILPSAMSMGADRTLYANLIETTFKGGISHEVAARLKEYLLPEAKQIPDIVRGLEECMNEMIKTRSTVQDANRQLELLKSTYGVGKEIVLTSLYWASLERNQIRSSVDQQKSTLLNKKTTHQELMTAIPRIEGVIEVTGTTKKNMVLAARGEWQAAVQKGAALSTDNQRLNAAFQLSKSNKKQFDEGGKNWRLIAGQHEGQDYEWVKTWLDNRITEKNHQIAEIDVKLGELQGESSRLQTTQASASSEALAAMLGGQSLEQALSDVSEREAIALEMGLGGLIEGVVGVGADALGKLVPSDDLPSLFWLGENSPEPKQTREIGEWRICVASGGYVVSSKDRTPTFGSEARASRRKAIMLEIDGLSTRRTNHIRERDRLSDHKENLIRNEIGIKFYLENRMNAFAIDDALLNAKKELDECARAQELNNQAQQSLQAQIEEVEKPYDNEILAHQTDLIAKKSAAGQLASEIEDANKALSLTEQHLTAIEQELQMMEEILGGDFTKLYAESSTLENFRIENVVGMQASRIAKLGLALEGESPSRISLLQSVNADDRVGTIRLWPLMMDIVKERIDSDLADMDGNDLMQAMQERRADLDTKLVTQENDVKIKARNIYVSLSAQVQSQKRKIEKLSELGEHIEFGNIVGIQIKLTPRAEMLTVLENFAEQLSLFSSQKPVDEVMKEFFESSMLRKIDMSGEALLDYRNYVDLVIEARRKGGDWKPAASLSGGESIGSGLAIALMLTRSIAAKGEIKSDQICPLFAVDEVHRLDPSGQAMIVNFANREGFQVLVTAATLAPGYSCTLYALNRVYQPDDRLIIRGVKVKPEKVAA